MDILGIFREIALRWILQDLTDDKSTLVQIMDCCRDTFPCRHMVSLDHNDLRSLQIYHIYKSDFWHLLPWCNKYMSSQVKYGRIHEEDVT